MIKSVRKGSKVSVKFTADKVETLTLELQGVLRAAKEVLTKNAYSNESASEFLLRVCVTELCSGEEE